MWIVCPRGLLFCYLAGMEAAFRNISKILRLCFPTVVPRWILFPVRALSCLMGWCLWRRALCLPFCCIVSLLCLLVCTMQLATSDSSQVWTKSGHTWGVSADPGPTGAQHRGSAAIPRVHNACQVTWLASWLLHRLQFSLSE